MFQDAAMNIREWVTNSEMLNLVIPAGEKVTTEFWTYMEY